MRAHPGDPLAAHLRDAGFQVDDIVLEAPAAREGVRAGLDLLHMHGEVSASAKAVAASLTADPSPEVVHIVRDEDEVRAVMSAALEHGAEIEVVIGAAPHGHRLLEAVAIMARLRGPGGCPWDAVQTHETLAKHLLDESYEVLDAIDRGDPKELRDELGDLLLQVLFHAQMGRDAQTFDIDDVAHGLVTKLTERHPHVFSDVEVSGPDEVVSNWDEIKARTRTGPFEGVPSSLPALAYAQKLLRRAGAAGLQVPEAAEIPGNEEALGMMLLAIVRAAQDLGLDAETALRRAAGRWRDSVEGSDDK